MTPRILSTGLAAALSLAFVEASASELYAGIGTSGLELGAGARIGESFAARLDLNVLTVRRNVSTSDVEYDAKMKFFNAGAYLDWFVAGGFRLTGGTIIGDRKVHGTARSSGNTITLNGVVYPVAAGDGLDFDAKFPTVTPYLGVGFGHHRVDAGLHFYADAGVAYGRPKVTLTPTASLAAKLNPGDLASEQVLAQDQANSLRAYPVLKLGAAYAF